MTSEPAAVPAGRDPDDGAPAASPARRSTPSFLRELPVLVLVALGLALLIKTFLVQAFFIPSGSMERTLHGCPGCQGDRVLVNKVVYDLREPRRGEIVVFSGEGSWGDNADVLPQPEGNLLQDGARGLARLLGVGPPGRTDYIKRVIGVSGDRVACCSERGRVTVLPAGSDVAVELRETYLFEDDAQPFCAAGTGEELCPVGAEGVLVPDGSLWVMGDHRSASTDSRVRGPVPVDRVVGRAFAVVWPLDRVTTLPVPSTFAERE